MNTLNILINDLDYTSYLHFPYSFQNTLDETLDTAQCTLVGMPQAEPFVPFSKVQLGSRTYALAEDRIAEIYGRKVYNHDLTLIEPTKILERFICGGKAFTNPRVVDYVSTPIRVIGSFSDGTWSTSHKRVIEAQYISATAITPKKVGTYTMPSLQSLTNGMITKSSTEYLKFSKVFQFYSKVGLDEDYIFKDFNAWKSQTTYSCDLYESKYLGEKINNQSFQVNCSKKGFYRFLFVWDMSDGETVNYSDSQYTFEISVLDDNTSVSSYTISDVVNTMLKTIEPLRVDSAFGVRDTQRFVFDSTGSHADVYTQISPEFQFDAGKSLWECLQEIGKYIHAIPRLKDDFKTITFDFLGETKQADFSKGRMFSNEEFYSASDYSESLTSTFSNMVDYDSIGGQMYDPSTQFYRTLRTSTESTRIEEGSSFIETVYPIAKIVELKCCYRNNNTEGEVDITKYLFEQTEYSLMSSYRGAYPSSKNYALYYTIGQPNINGLWFKPQAVTQIGDAINNYSIVNIIQSAIAESNVSNDEDVTIWNATDYINKLSFRVKYVPLISGIVKQHKTTYDGTLPLSLAYNQFATKLSRKAFGEALKGQLAMLGTTTRKVKYIFKSVDDLVNPGEKDGIDFISSVTAEVNKDYVLAEINLSTNYNQLGAYVQVPNDVRLYEIANQHDRYIILEDDINITTVQPDANDDATVGTIELMNTIKHSFDGNTASTARKYPDLARIRTFDYSMDEITPSGKGVLLPVMTVAVGNSVALICKTKDNVSAGSRAFAYDGLIQYNTQKDVPIGDSVYSKAKYIRVDFENENSLNGTIDQKFGVYRELPEATNIERDASKNPVATATLLAFKDSSDNINLSYQVNFKSDDELIIGSDLACRLLLNENYLGTSSLVLKYYDEQMNELTGDISSTATQVGQSETNFNITVQNSKTLKVDLTATANATTPTHQSWRLYLQRYSSQYFLCGKNTNLPFTNLFFSLHHKE